MSEKSLKEQIADMKRDLQEIDRACKRRDATMKLMWLQADQLLDAAAHKHQLIGELEKLIP